MYVARVREKGTTKNCRVVGDSAREVWVKAYRLARFTNHEFSVPITFHILEKKGDFIGRRFHMDGNGVRWGE